MILLISFCYVHDLVPKNLAEGWKAEVSKGGFVRHCRGKCEPSGKPEHAEGEEGTGDGVDEETEEDSEGADASSLLPCPVEGCIRTYQRYHNLERHLLFGKCKLVSEKYTLLDTAKLAYAEKVQEGFTTQPTLAAPTTTEVSSEAPLVQGWALKGTKKATRFNENQRQYLDNKFQIGQESGHKVDPEKVSRDMRYARKDNGERRFDVEEFLTAQQIQSYFSRTAAKLKHAVAAQSGHDSIDDNDSQAAQEQEAYSCARFSVLRQCELLHPIVYDTLNICSLYSSNKLSKLSVAQLRLICSFYNMDIEEQQSKRKAPYITFISDLAGSCSCTKV